jgi:RHH-type proline utilization regulon transcriptional repressor/proline dehydrogenase/delta 1-pyrroline-5-carboxylate dehydrogenase
MIRLIEGRLLVSEIKAARSGNIFEGYPVFAYHTDVSYLACAHRHWPAPDHHLPQFATHNAQTVASDLRHMASSNYYSGQCTDWSAR